MVIKIRGTAPSEETLLSIPANKEVETLRQKVGRFVIEPRGGFLLSGKASNASYVGMDFSWLIRSVTDLFPNPTKYNFFYQSEGFASAFNFIIGIYDVVKSFFRIEHALKIGDYDGTIDAAVDLTRAGVQTGAGAAITAYRPVAVVVAAQGFSSASLLGRVSYGLGQLATGLFGIFYMLCGINGARSLFRCVKFYTKYYQKKTPEEKYNFLKTYLDVSKEERRALRHNCRNDEKLKQKYIEEGRTILPLIYDKEKKCSKVSKNEKKLARIGRLFVENKLKMKKEAELTRLIGALAVKDIKGGAPDLDKLMSTVQGVAIEKIVINSLAVVFGFAGIAATVAGFIFTGPVGFALVTLAMIFAVILPMSFVDAYSHYVDLRESGPGKHDKKFLIINSVVALIAMGVSIVLTSIFSFGILPILLTLLVSGVWLGLNVISYRNILNLERKAKEEKEEKEIQESSKIINICN
ncbi:MAG: hypothetical protein V4494_02080 [Chlamydiota bacterium]